MLEHLLTTVVDLCDYVGPMASIDILARAAPATEESVAQYGGYVGRLGMESINELFDN